LAHLLFIDESGQDGKDSPYEVLAGLAVEDKRLWSLIRQLSDLQEHLFGLHLFRAYGSEAKAQKLLKKKAFRHANQLPPIKLEKRRELSKQLLEDGQNPTKEQLTALGQAKIAYCKRSMEICRGHGCVAFASIVPKRAPRPKANILRKDYAFLFERFFHFLNNSTNDEIGLVIFDELDKRQSQILSNQMYDYFLKTRKGRIRSRLIVPEPMFVHSDLTTLVQMADIVAYVISWGIRIRSMNEPHRTELYDIGSPILDMRYHNRTESGNDTWGFKVIQSLLVNGA